MRSLFRFTKHLFTQLDPETTFDGILDLCQPLAFYIIDKDLRIMYWSPALEKLTGLESEALLGKACPSEYVIDLSQNHRTETLSLERSPGNTRTVNKSSCLLIDKKGSLAGGIGLLFPSGEQENLPFLPRKQAAQDQNFHGIISRSPAMRNVFQIISNAAETEATVLVRGESGSGKELVAKAIHDLSSRRNAPFLAVNCAALSANLLESELFGHVRGAFTGAIKDMPE